MPSIGGPELLLIALVILLLFGASRLPKLGRSMGQSISGFKKGLKEVTAEQDELEPAVERIEAKTDAKAS
jgi:sec-independent protein translocase protein TatA